MRDAALRILGARAHSRAELRQKLLRRGFAPGACEDCLDWLSSLCYLDDDAYALELAQALSEKGYGPARVGCELRRRGLSSESANAALDALPPPDAAVDNAIARLVRGGPLDERGKKRIADSLMRKGFSWQDVREGMLRLESEDR